MHVYENEFSGQVDPYLPENRQHVIGISIIIKVGSEAK